MSTISIRHDDTFVLPSPQILTPKKLEESDYTLPVDSFRLENIQLPPSLLQRITDLYKKLVVLYYAHTSMIVRNFIRVLVAGLLSALGGVISGDPRIVAILGIAAVYFGSAVGGFGNAFSTWFAWETSAEERIARLERIVQNLTDRLKQIEDRNL